MYVDIEFILPRAKPVHRELGGFHLYLFELAFINQLYSRSASLFQQSVAND